MLLLGGRIKKEKREFEKEKAAAEKPNARKVIDEVFNSLGERKPVKERLAACLWKTMKDNKKHYKVVNVDKDSIKFIPRLTRKYGL